MTESLITGKERDAETSLDYFGARYYGSNMGRFTSSDPKTITRQRLRDPQQWNAYQYSRNNPLVYVDPDGKEIQFVNADSAKHGLSDARAGLPPSQRSAVSTVTADGNTTLSVNGDAARAAGPNSLLGRLATEAASSKVVQVNYVSPTDTIKYVDGGTTRTTSLDSLTKTANQGNSDPSSTKYIDGLTLPEKGDANNPGSAVPGATSVYVSNDTGVNSPATFYEEVVVHAGTYVATGDADKASHANQNLNNDSEKVRKEVENNERKTQ